MISMRHADSCASSISGRQRGEVMDVYGLSDKGLRRELNEDSYIYEVNKRGDLLVCVCDGIGGSAAGEVASSLAVSLLQERFAQASAFCAAGTGHFPSMSGIPGSMRCMTMGFPA